MYLKYQLPSDPTVYVDLLDDEDVQLMFDEVSHSCCLSQCCAASQDQLSAAVILLGAAIQLPLFYPFLIG